VWRWGWTKESSFICISIKRRKILWQIYPARSYKRLTKSHSVLVYIAGLPPHTEPPTHRLIAKRTLAAISFAFEKQPLRVSLLTRQKTQRHWPLRPLPQSSNTAPLLLAALFPDSCRTTCRWWMTEFKSSLRCIVGSTQPIRSEGMA